MHMKGDLTADTNTYLPLKSFTKDILRCLDFFLSKIIFLFMLFCNYSDAPEKVRISGPEKSSRGSSLLLECRSSPSVPAARLRWRLWRHEPGELASGGHSDAAGDLEAESTVEEEENGGLTASSWLTLQAGTSGEHQV